MAHVFGRTFVKRFARRYRTVVCPVCLSVTLVYCGNTVGWITWQGGRPQPWPHRVRWGPSCPSPKGAQPPIFGPCLLWPNGWMDQDVTWQGGRPRPRQHCVRWGPSCPSPKGAEQPPPLFGSGLLWPNGSMDQDATCKSTCYGRGPNYVNWVQNSHVSKLVYTDLVYCTCAFSALTMLDKHPACKKLSGCWHRYLPAARCKRFTYGPADATASPSPLALLKSRLV